jgi:hypothetical protein
MDCLQRQLPNVSSFANFIFLSFGFTSLQPIHLCGTIELVGRLRMDAA